MAQGLQEMEQLRAAGFTEQDVRTWKQDTLVELQGAGFNDEEINEYFGKKSFDESRIKSRIENPPRAQQVPTSEGNTSEAENADAPGGPGGVVPEAQAATGGEIPMGVGEQPQLTEATSVLEAFEAGFDMSVTGLMREKPDKVLSENAGMFYRIASSVGTLAGDVPAMMAGAGAGAIAGGMAGTVTLPVVGTVGGAALGATAGAFAVPEGLRTAYIEAYENGEIDDVGEFLERAAAITINTLKGGAIGAATAGAGGLATKVASRAGAGVAVKTTAQLSSEVAAMTVVASGLEGEMPSIQEFTDAAVLVGGLRVGGKAFGKTSKKIREMYKRTGMKPKEIADRAIKDPKFRQELLSENKTPGVEIMSKAPSEIIKDVSNVRVIPEKVTSVKPKAPAEVVASTAVDQILSKVGEAPGRKAKLPTARDLYKDFVDQTDPIYEVTQKLSSGKATLKAEDNPHILARMVPDAKAKAKHFFEKGTFDFEKQNAKGPALKSVLEKAPDLETLKAYMISRRVIEKSEQGLATGFDVNAARAVVRQHKKSYDAVAKELTNFQNEVLDYVKESGVLSKESLDNIKNANRDYIPFKRIFEMSEEVGARKGGGKAGSLKKFKGSEKDIQDPINAVLENTVELIELAERNRPGVALINLASKSPDQTLIVKSKDARQPVKISADELKKVLPEGVDAEALSPLVVFRKQSRQLAPDEFQVFRDGKREVYKTTPELAEAMQVLGGDSTSMNMAFRVMNGITQIKKVGITFTPDFILRNFQRDYVTGTVFTKSKISPMDVMGAIGDIIKQNDSYYTWLKSGGANGAFLEFSNNYVMKDLLKLQRQTGFMGAARNVVSAPIDAMRVAATLAEQSLRLAEFKNVRQKTGSNIEGGFASREITLDFQRVGAKVSALNSITAFLNVSIQGLDKTARAFIEKPGATSLRAGAAITTPSVLLWWANKDDQRVQNLPRWERDLFWIVPTDSWEEADPGEAANLPDYMVETRDGKTFVNKGTVYRIPKPMELGVLFGSLPERMLDAFYKDNPGQLKDFEESVGNLIIPSIVPDAIAPVIEQYFNKSFFTGSDIIPHHMENILPEYQATEYTSETAKTIGTLVSQIKRDTPLASPMIIDNYIQSWGGSLGRYAVDLSDKALKASGIQPDIPEPESTMADIPFVRAFVARYPRNTTQPVSDFYDNFRQADKIQKTLQFLRREGNFEALQKEMLLTENQAELAKLDGIKRGLSNISKLLTNVNKDPSMSREEKRMLIDELYYMKTEMAKEGNAIFELLESELEGK